MSAARTCRIALIDKKGTASLIDIEVPADIKSAAEIRKLLSQRADVALRDWPVGVTETARRNDYVCCYDELAQKVETEPCPVKDIADSEFYAFVE